MSGPWEDYASQSQGPWNDYATQKPAAPQQTSQALGFEQGIGHFLSNMAGAGDYAGRKVGLPMDSIESGLFGGKTLQQAQNTIANPSHPANVAPGRVGMFGANLLSTLPTSLMTGPIGGGALAGAMLTNADNPMDIAKDAAIGAGTSWLTGKALSGAAKALPSKISAVPTTAELASAKSAAYRTADSSGMIISGNSVANLASKIENDLANEGFDATLHPGTARALARVQQAADTTNAAKGNVTLKGMDILRKIATGVGGANVMNKADGHMSGIVRDNIDDFVNGLQPSDVLGGQVDQGGINALNQARRLWRTTNKSQTIDSLMNKAEMEASGYSASGVENTIRRNFKNVAVNPKKMAQYTTDEQDAIRKIVAGGPIGNALRRFGKFAPHGVVSTGADVLIGGKMGALPLMIGGWLSKAGATAATERNADLLSAIVRNGGRTPIQTPGLFGKALMYSANPAARIAPPLLFSSGIVPSN